MIYRLDKSEFDLLNECMNEVENFPEVYSVMNCTNPGAIYVDDNKNPKSALVWNQGMQGHYLVGESENRIFNNNIKVYIEQTIVNELTDRGINWFEVSGLDKKWESVIEEIFMDKGIEFEYQFVYHMPKMVFASSNQSQTQEYSIKKLTRDDLKSGIANINYLTAELELFWGNMENYFENGTCFYATENNEIVSFCYSGFIANGFETIGIETLSDYRKKGYAFELSKLFIDDCISRKVNPHWDCSKDNVGSIRLAEKLGFEKVSEYKCYWFNF